MLEKIKTVIKKKLKEGKQSINSIFVDEFFNLVIQ